MGEDEAPADPNPGLKVLNSLQDILNSEVGQELQRRMGEDEDFVKTALTDIRRQLNFITALLGFDLTGASLPAATAPGEYQQQAGFVPILERLERIESKLNIVSGNTAGRR